MRGILTLLGATAALASSAAAGSSASESHLDKRWYPITPKVMIVSMFSYESVWSEPLGLDQNVTVPGLSPLYPVIQCNNDGSVCQFTVGEGEINAACSMSALLLSDKFDFKQSYFLLAGIAGVNPFQGTLGSVGLARFAVQVALAYELDARQIPSNWTTGYWLQGSDQPGETTTDIYGTEVFELNTNLRQKVSEYTNGVALNDTEAAASYRARFDYSPANQPPSVFFGDVSTSDVYFAGSLLDEAFGNITKLWTNNTGTYALTAQEDNASFEAMVRAQKAGLMDFSRVILMRTASDFDRAPPGLSEIEAFQYEQGGFEPAINNILVAGKPIVEGILNNWSEYEGGIPPQDGFLYTADDLHTLAQRKRAMRRRSIPMDMRARRGV